MVRDRAVGEWLAMTPLPWTDIWQQPKQKPRALARGMWHAQASHAEGGIETPGAAGPMT